MRKKIIIITGLLAVLLLVYSMGWYQALTLENLNAQIQVTQARNEASPVATAATFSLVYTALVAMSVPGASLMTLFAGAIFGVFEGTLLISVSSTIGATGSFLVSRYLIRDLIEARFAAPLNTLNAGFLKDGARYLFTLRLVPIFPFFVINLATGLTRLPTFTFFWVSMVGMLPGTILLVNAGHQLGAVSSIQEVMTPSVLGSFVALGLFPWMIKLVMGTQKTDEATDESN